MLRTGLIISIVTLSILGMFGLYSKCCSRPPSSKLIERQSDLSKMSEVQPQVELPEVVKEINARVAKIQNISCDNLDIKVWQNGYRVRLTGKIYSEKPRGFRMEFDSFFGKEVDVGSNDKEFWYWSRRDKQPGLHYAAHSDYEKTRLKTPLNPIFLRTTLGIEPLSHLNCKIVDNGKDIMMSFLRNSASGDPVLFSIFVNKTKKQVTGYLVTRKDGKLIASCDIQEYANDIPVKILYNWYDEDKVMLMELKQPKVNQYLNPSLWAMPDYKPKINMAEQ